MYRLLLRIGTVSFRKWLVRTLAVSGRADAFELVYLGLSDRDFSVREAAARSLGRLGDVRGVTLLATSLINKTVNYHTCAYALSELSRSWKDTLEARTVLSELIVALDAERVDVRRTAVEVLGLLRCPCAFNELVRKLKDENENVRYAAANALVRYRDARAIRPLAKALADGNLSVRHAEVSLRDISPSWRETPEARAIATEYINALTDQRADIRSLAVQALHRLQHPAAPQCR